jgi:hypothetical protein
MGDMMRRKRGEGMYCREEKEDRRRRKCGRRYKGG